MTTARTYLDEHRETYLEMAERITPDVANWTQVYARAAFAILSAHVGFAKAVEALTYVNLHKGETDPKVIRGFGLVSARADYCNALPVGPRILALTRQQGESYHEQRVRLTETVAGLGLCKASFLVALLDPVRADVACLDTHIRQYLKVPSNPRDLGLATYVRVESRIRRIAQFYEVGTFVAQWAIWDHQRGTLTNHAIFPGSHRV